MPTLQQLLALRLSLELPNHPQLPNNSTPGTLPQRGWGLMFQQQKQKKEKKRQTLNYTLHSLRHHLAEGQGIVSLSHTDTLHFFFLSESAHYRGGKTTAVATGAAEHGHKGGGETGKNASTFFQRKIKIK